VQTLWNLDEDAIQTLVGIHLSHHGQLTGAFISTPNSRVYMLDSGIGHSPRYLMAKAPWPRDKTDPILTQSRLEYFCREAEHTTKIAGHPYLHRFGQLEFVMNVPFFISAKRDGTLEDILAGESLTITDALVMSIQISRGLSYCQDQGLVAHQDLKPANIFVERLERKFGQDVPFRFRALVSDFELSNAFRDLGRASGSRPYMSPEQHQAESGGAASPFDLSLSDTFSFGVLLHELVTGGLHPIGERTADIWPTPLPDKSTKWKRSTPWRQWIDAGAPLKWPRELLPGGIYDIVKDSLSLDLASRPPIQSVQERLWAVLLEADAFVAESLLMATQIWEENLIADPKANWPHGYAMVDKLRQRFASRGVNGSL
jgi:serine/threonine protein kinase